MTSGKVGPVIPNLSVVILAGGLSKRLGRDKSLLELAGEPLLARTVRTLSVLSDDLVVVTNSASRYAALALDVRLVPDEQQGVGSLMGIYSGLKAAQHPRALAVACDMPLLSVPLLRHMATLTGGYDVVIPRLGPFVEPLHAIYDKNCLPSMARLLAQGRRQIVAFFDDVRVRFVEQHVVERFDPHHHSFLNVNTAEDWAKAEELVRAEAAS
jgi:molybdopterin-guanine dinucleotide biosynthesis protein A